jgi:uncharacterized membrane protein
MEEAGAPVAAPRSGYLQFLAFDTLVEIATASDGAIQILYRPGHFVVEGFPLAKVWPPEAAPEVARALRGVHFTGPNRTLTQDLAFAIDQLVEIAIRALSPAVNDTFTALTCIDWLSDGLCKLAAQWNPRSVHRDRNGNIRVIVPAVQYSHFVERAFDKVRQAGRGMPAVMIRQLDALAKIMACTTSDEQRAPLLEQGEMILRSCEESVPEPGDRADVRRRYDALASRAQKSRQDAATSL